jgi:BirA family transcriptional regulator, biotin operon repressor / biotin---[acetyl-CoA-carboxylase] ligase
VLAPLGLPRLHLRRTESTNTLARELAVRGAPHGTLITAGEQTAGRGRQGRAWTAPPGSSLLCSLILRDPSTLLSLAAGVAVAELCGQRATVPATVGLKWPNDVLLDGRKVAGILVEGRPQENWAVLGIGLNVAVRPADLPAELRDRAGTLGLAADDVEPVLAGLLAALERWLAGSPREVLAAVRERDVLRGRALSWAGGDGVAAGIDGEGRLLVDRPGGERVALDAGEVHLGTT